MSGTYVRKLIHVGLSSRAIVLPQAWVRGQLQKHGNDVLVGIRSGCSSSGEEYLVLSIMKKN